LSNGPSLSGISIVCVFNDPSVRRDCLDRSLARYCGDVDVEYLPIDNTSHRFTSAGAALNHGAASARHEVVAFAHQDVFLHSIDRVAAAGSALSAGEWGLLGANGVPHVGRFAGRMRDRVQLIGSHEPVPVDVDSVDEVLFLVSRSRLLQHPLTEDPDLAWHAYAVEYGLRMRRLGLRVGAVDMAVTHNSLTINLDRLDVGHRRVAALYPEQLPLRTTCGPIGSRPDSWRSAPVLRSHRWRLRWLRKSAEAVLARRRLAVPVVLSDIRHEVDMLDFSVDSPLHLLSLDREGGFAEFGSDPVTLTRCGKPVVMHSFGDLPSLVLTADEITTGGGSVLVPDLELEDLGAFASMAEKRSPWVTGLLPGGVWVLGGRAAEHLPPEWSLPQAVPLGARRRRRRSLEACIVPVSRDEAPRTVR
jgi:hypothetical protein